MDDQTRADFTDFFKRTPEEFCALMGRRLPGRINISQASIMPGIEAGLNFELILPETGKSIVFFQNMVFDQEKGTVSTSYMHSNVVEAPDGSGPVERSGFVALLLTNRLTLLYELGYECALATTQQDGTAYWSRRGYGFKTLKERQDRNFDEHVLHEARSLRDKKLIKKSDLMGIEKILADSDDRMVNCKIALIDEPRINETPLGIYLLSKAQKVNRSGYRLALRLKEPESIPYIERMCAQADKYAPVIARKFKMSEPDAAPETLTPP